jgi:quinol monooxygenase YgiN
VTGPAGTATDTGPAEQVGPVAFVVRIRPRPDRRPEVLAALTELVPAVQGEPGCGQYVLHEVQGSDDFMTIERWSSGRDAERHTTSAAVRRYLARVAGLVEPSIITALHPVPPGAPATDPR